jgi:diguanylate cyclase (GGDEF)-like protein/PAS domain S-box-containing protein
MLSPMSVVNALDDDAPELGAALSEPDFFVEVLNTLTDAVYLVDRQRTIRFWNGACEEITGYRAGDVVGHHCYEDILRHVDEHGRRLCVGLCPLAHTIHDGTPRHTRVWLHHRDGHRVEVQVGVRPVRDSGGRIVGAIETFTDESERAATQARLAELEHLAMVDPLTGVPNRRFLEMTLSSRLAELRRYAAEFVVAFADIDHFKRVNDDNGHDVADDVLRMVANTLKGNLRGSDTIARFGGEEFVLILNHSAGTDATQLCERLNRLVAASSIDGNGGSVSVTISFGATAARREDSYESILHRADDLLYQSKREGRDRVTTDVG